MALFIIISLKWLYNINLKLNNTKKQKYGQSCWQAEPREPRVGAHRHFQELQGPHSEEHQLVSARIWHRHRWWDQAVLQLCDQEP